MNKNNQENSILSAFFSDGTERFRTPSEPDPGQEVTVRLRAPGTAEDPEAVLLLGDMPEIPMRKTGSKGCFSMFEARFTCPAEPVSYRFRIRYEGREYYCGTNGAVPAGPEGANAPCYDFRMAPGFHTPRWARGACMYQILPDRFCNGDPSNDVRDGEYSYNYQHVRRIPDWNTPPAEDDYRCFYGGDLAGILEKLDYLQDLGVGVIYLNPVFLAPSSHKYDTQDYDHIDPHLGVIVEDADLPLKDWEMHNGYARQYLTRVLSKTNLERSDALFAELCRRIHERGMKIVLDGVFNHCGSFHRWMDREGIYREKPGYEIPGAWQSKNSPYRNFFRFTAECPGYEAWWGVETLPKLCYEQSEELCREMFSVAEKWLRPPYSIDGWRLDVAADVTHSPEYNHEFWQEFRKHVKAVNPDALIIAEHYGDPSEWLRGGEWDTVMNYDAFMEPVTYFFTGMEKHSDSFRKELYQNGEAFFASMYETMARLPWGSLQCAMNELSNHDHSRFLSRTNCTVGRTQTLGPEAADAGTDKAVLREAVVVQMTWPGAPTVYYGDEAGLAGWTDPDNRRCYPWGEEDQELIGLHRELIALRRGLPVLQNGSLIPLGAGPGWISYARFDEKDCVVVVCNNDSREQVLSPEVWRAGAEPGEEFVRIFRTDPSGHTAEAVPAAKVADGRLSLSVPGKCALILKKTSPSS